jgi:hypothetical protein
MRIITYKILSFLFKVTKCEAMIVEFLLWVFVEESMFKITSQVSSWHSHFEVIRKVSLVVIFEYFVIIDGFYLLLVPMFHIF